MSESVPALVCISCKLRYRVASYRPDAHYTCKKCGGPIAPEKPLPMSEQPTLVNRGTVLHPSSAAAAQVPGTPATPRLGKYDILGELGRGGMGVVYKARQKGIDRVVAVKTLLQGPGTTPEMIKRFQREVKACGKLHHPNIVGVHEVDEADGVPYFVMDYVDGTPLDKVMKGRPLPVKQAAAWIRDLARALAYAHGEGVVHRDLKPGNVIISKDGAPCLMDFGLAKDTGAQSLLSMSGDVFGTPAYMSPEQASGKIREVDARTDVYALGVMLYEMISGQLPFRGASVSDTIYKVIHEDPPAPRTLKPGVDMDLEAVCLKAMDKEKDRRYPDAQALAEDLESYLSGEGVNAKPLTGFTRMTRKIRRNKSMVRAVVLATVACAAVGGGLFFIFRKSEIERLKAELADPLAAVRQAAVVRLLSELGQDRFKEKALPQALDLLASAAADEDDGVALAALEGTGNLARDARFDAALKASSRVAEVLEARICHSAPHLTETAIRCAGYLRLQQAVKELLPLLDDPRREVRLAAIRSLGQLGNQSALFPLMKLSLKDHSMTAEVTQAIDGIYARGAVHSKLRQVQKGMTDLLRANQQHDEDLEAALDETSGVEHDPVKRGLGILRDGSARDDDRAQVAYELAKLGRKEAVPDLLDTMTVDPEGVGLAAAWAAEELDPKAALDSLSERLEKGDPKARARAALALGRPGHPEIAEKLMAALGAGPDPELAEALCRALGRTGERNALPYLVRAAKQGEEAVRTSALAALRAITGKDLGNDPEAYVQAR